MTQFKRRLPILIFDFGNVVAFFDYRKACDALGQPLGLSGEALLEMARSRNFTAIVQQYERGAITAEVFSERVCALVDLSVSHEEFASAWSDIFWLNEPVAHLVGFLKRQGYTLVLGSNTNGLHAAQFRQQFASTLAHFDQLVLSHEVGHLKPSAEFYLACAAAAGADPASCIFIDDLAENVEGAKAAGLSALHFNSFPKLLSDLQAVGVDVSPLLESNPA
jgi:epoxide hydrolase-like predicted phosphatase